MMMKKPKGQDGQRGHYFPKLEANVDMTRLDRYSQQELRSFVEAYHKHSLEAAYILIIPGRLTKQS
jgi:hypothetical protein